MTFFEYFTFGVNHVIPYGFDHILFIISLYLLSSNLKTVLIQCSVFTFSHSFALAISSLGYFIPNPNIIEPLIAFSILYTAIENIVRNKSKKYRIIVIFLFGLIHGMGFSFALNEIGLPKSDFITALFSFNIGVELGQVIIILLTYFFLVHWFKEKSWYKDRIVYPVSSIIGTFSIVLFITRIF